MSRLAFFPVSLEQCHNPDGVDVSQLRSKHSHIFENLTVQSFTDDAVWRDSYALTGTLRTFYGANGIFQAWMETSSLKHPRFFEVKDELSRVASLPGGLSWVDIGFSFETRTRPQLHCTAILSMRYDCNEHDWKIWCMRTVLDQLKRLPSVDTYQPRIHSERPQAQSLLSCHELAYDCVIVGAGQAGLCTAGRCQALGISYLMIDTNQQVGDNWRRRYDSARLHTLREYAHLPFERTFVETDPEYLGKDDLADGYGRWVERFDINYCLETTLEEGHWDEATRRWKLILTRHGKAYTVKPAFVIMAVGAGGQVPNMPQLPDREHFPGTVVHSSEYRSAHAWAGGRGVVVGTANTAHDVAQDMLEADISSITMVQRSDTYVLPAEWFAKVQSQSYNANVPTTLADKLNHTSPHAVTRLVSMAVLHEKVRHNPQRFDDLERVGFRVDRFGDPVWHILERLGGHYVDVGTSARISQGLIKVKSDSIPTNYTAHGLGFADGTELRADLIVFATGFDLNLRNRVRELFGKDVASQIGDFSMIDEEGELAGAWKFQHLGLACHGGAIGASRWYSRFLALHMKAALLGEPMAVYSATPVPPRRHEAKAPVV